MFKCHVVAIELCKTDPEAETRKKTFIFSEATQMSGAKNVVSFLKQCIASMSESGGLDAALKGCQVVSGSPGHCTLSLVLDKSHSNMYVS